MPVSYLNKGNEIRPLPTLTWRKGALRILEQTLLPEKTVFIDLKTPEAVWKAIRRLAVRGAPAIGCAAAYGVVLGLPAAKYAGPAHLLAAAERAADYLATSRPTAVNLFWALDRMKRRAAELAAEAARAGPSPAGGSAVQPLDRRCRKKGAPAFRAGAAAWFRKNMLAEANAIFNEDLAMSRAIGHNGLPLICPIEEHKAALASLGAKDAVPRGRSVRRAAARPVRVLTHCNAGGLATSGLGTALAPVYAAHAAGRAVYVYADETRPLCQGARLTAWELAKAGVPVTVQCDGMAAVLLRDAGIDLVIVGADRVAANGDTANKIGTLGVAVLAKHYGVPFYVLGPTSTIDMNCKTGADIVIEERDPEEIRSKFYGKPMAPEGVRCYNPAFDVTGHELITAIVTEKGVLRNL